jgi:small subunit ribosomal protein S1
VPFGAFVQVGDGIEGLVHISEMSAHHIDLPEQVVTPGEELWVKIIDLDLQRRRISLSIKQAAEGGEVAAEYQEHFGEHAYDDEGNYIGGEYEEGDEEWSSEEYDENAVAADGEAPVAADGEAADGVVADDGEVEAAPDAEAAPEVEAAPDAELEPEAVEEVEAVEAEDA